MTMSPDVMCIACSVCRSNYVLGLFVAKLHDPGQNKVS